MSSLMQHHRGIENDRKVTLVAYLVDKVPMSEAFPDLMTDKDRELIEGTEHPVLYTFRRVPAGMMGAWVVFRYNGEEHVPDLSVPIRLEKLPRDAVRVPDQAALRYWLDNGEHWMATALKAAVKGIETVKVQE